MNRGAALVSVHDVTPAALPQVRELLEFVRSHVPAPAVTLLVVPGMGWADDELDQLRRWQADGYRFAGHGWTHRIERFGGTFHRLHGALLSRREAEHLQHSCQELEELVRRCHGWFAQTGLDAPTLYVPPAWAMGALPARHLATLPFRLYEDLLGVIDAATGDRLRLPLTGYLADTPLRAAFLRVSNAFNLALRAGPVRIGIHPPDLSLPLAPSLRRHLERTGRFLAYEDLL